MKAKDIAAKAANLAAVSPAALKLISLLEQPELANEEVVATLKHDAILTAKLLRVCNSPSLGFDEPIGSVDQAVLLLGYWQVLQMTLSLALGDALAAPMANYAVAANELWRHSLVVAVAAEVLVRKGPVSAVDPAIAFTTGLLHDIGKLAMNQALTAKSLNAIRYRIAEHGASRVEAEKEIVGCDHAEVGGCLLQLWRLPDPIIEGVANHHAPVIEPGGRLSPVINVANCVAHLVGSAPGWEPFALKMQSSVVAALELTPESLENLVFQVRESCEKADTLMPNP